MKFSNLENTIIMELELKKTLKKQFDFIKLHQIQVI